jgi:hypothetical protein
MYYSGVVPHLAREKDPFGGRIFWGSMSFTEVLLKVHLGP